MTRPLDLAAALIGLAAVLLLALTGLRAWVGGELLAGWSLLAHALAAGPFLAVMLWIVFRQSGRHVQAHTPLLRRVAYWFTVVSGWTAAAAMLAAMFPWFDQPGTAALLDLHRWSTVAFLAGLLGWAAAGLSAARLRKSDPAA